MTAVVYALVAVTLAVAGLVWLRREVYGDSGVSSFEAGMVATAVILSAAAWPLTVAVGVFLAAVCLLGKLITR